MSEPSTANEPLLTKKQTMWVLVSLGWFIIGGVALVTGQQLFGIAWILLGVGGIYRIVNPG